MPIPMNSIIPAHRNHTTPDQLIFKLIRSFPCLAIKARTWLSRATAFDPNEFYQLFECASSGEVLCALFILNVWSHSYADSKGWKFDLFAFMNCADGGNRDALLNWMAKPYWP
jgi:hypothetical protein